MSIVRNQREKDMRNCNNCGVAINDPKQVICLNCGAVADQPISANEPSPSVDPGNVDRSEYKLLQIGGQFSNVAYGRMEYLKGVLKLAGFMIAATIPFSILAAAGSETMAGITFLAFLPVALWLLMKQIDLMFGRYQDMGIRSMWLKVVLIILNLFPLVAFLSLLAHLAVPRNTVNL